MYGYGNGGGASLADIAAVVNGHNNGGYGYGCGGDLWAIILIIAMMNGGFGNWGGFGGNFGGGRMIPCGGGCGGGFNFNTNMDTQFLEQSIQRSHDAQIGKLDRLGDGLANLGYAEQAQVNNLGTAVTTVGTNVLRAIDNSRFDSSKDTASVVSAITDLGWKQKDCCCDLEKDIASLARQEEKQTCELGQAIHAVGDRIAQQNERQYISVIQEIKDGFCNLSRENDKRYISQLEQEKNEATMKGMLQSVVKEILGTTNPEPRPAYLVQSPNCGGAVLQVLDTNNGNCNNCCSSNNGTRFVRIG